jgi:hypothetical protein
MDYELSKYWTQSKIIIKANLEEVWSLLCEESHLELVHPFCKSHRKVVWNNQKKIDELTYLNGLTYKRTFYSWQKNKGFKLMIGKEKGKKSRVEWEIRALNEMTELKIKVTPYISEKFNIKIYYFLLRIYILPKLRKYLNYVNMGVKFYLEEKTAVKNNQFGKHKYFS